MGRAKKTLLHILPALLFWLGVWQLCALLVDWHVNGRGNELLLPYPASVWRALTAMLGTGAFWGTVSASLARIAVGLACGILLGAALGAPPATSHKN